MSFPEREGGKPKVNAAWDAIGEVIKAWATEGHSVAVPGLGTGCEPLQGSGFTVNG